MTKRQRLSLVSRVGGLMSSMLGHPLLLGGSLASRTDKEIFLRCLEAWLFLAEDLMLRQDIGDEGRESRMNNFIHSLSSSDFVDVLSLLDDLYQGFILDKWCPLTFKQFVDSTSSGSVDLRRLLSPINLSIYSFLSEKSKERKAHLLASIAQFLRFPRKLEFQDIDLETKALEEYRNTEKELATLDLDKSDQFLNEIEKIIKEWFSDFHIEGLKPVHGSGSVAEGNLSILEKFARASVDEKIKLILRNPSEPEDWVSYFPFRPKDGLVRTSRTVFVPKTATKLRTISMEPITLQYIQQGVMYELYRYIERHPILGCHVRLSDQTQNQVWALVGSKYGTYCTIDLSHASDSVSWNLVRRVFRSVPRLYKWLLATRSNKTLLPDGTEIALLKYAPMGSALCFPIECIIFSAIVEYASRKASLGRPEPNWFWSVYGDDIVCPTELYGEIVEILQACGFTVNMSKSYCTGEYRESCGKEYYAGYDITPLYYRIPFYRKRPSPSAVASWASSANNALFRSLPTYRWYLINKCLQFPSKNKVYFCGNPQQSPYLFSPQPTNFHVRKRWNKDYQRWEGKFLSVKCRPRGVVEVDEESIAYFIRLVEMSRSDSDQSHEDESQHVTALRGCVEFFSSTALPLEPFVVVDKTITHDW